MTARKPNRGIGLRLRITLLVELILIVTVVLTVAVTTYPVSRAAQDRLQQEALATTDALVSDITASQLLRGQADAALTEQMVAQARLTAYLVAAAEQAGMTPHEINDILAQLAESSAIEQFVITDESARAYLTNTGQQVIFSPNPIEQPQTSKFFSLLNQKDGVVVQEELAYTDDGEAIRYVGVSGVDRPRIVQIASRADLLADLARQYSLQGLLDRLVARSDVVYARLIDAEGKTLATGRDHDAPAAQDAAQDAADVAQALSTDQARLRWEPGILIVTAAFHPAEDAAAADGAVVIYFSTAALDRLRQRAVTNGLLAGILMCACGALISYALAGGIARPLQSMVRLTQHIADGDLSRRIQVGQGGELGQLQEALRRMGDNLRNAILNIRRSARQVGRSAGEINLVVGELNETVAEQSAAVAQTTAAMEELRSVAAQIAQGAQTVDEAAAHTQEDVQAGLQAVAETAARMEEIRTDNEASVREILALGRKAQQIGEVMNLIEDIAAQTRLISINASIEAAAAGEHGERFNVVAAQVRQLAENVARSTDAIRQRIREIQAATNELTVAAETSAKKIDRGVALSRATQEVLDQIAAGADRTTVAAGQISISTRQQQTAVDQVLEALHQLGEDVNRVSASSSQTAQVVADLGRLAHTLNQLVAHFDLGDTAPAPQANPHDEGDHAD